jgi:hypothetical protein
MVVAVVAMVPSPEDMEKAAMVAEVTVAPPAMKAPREATPQEAMVVAPREATLPVAMEVETVDIAREVTPVADVV